MERLCPIMHDCHKIKKVLLFNLCDGIVEHNLEFWMQNKLVCGRSNMPQQRQTYIVD